MTDTKMICGACNWWQQGDSADGHGRCVESTISGMPVTYWNRGCVAENPREAWKPKYTRHKWIEINDVATTCRVIAELKSD